MNTIAAGLRYPLSLGFGSVLIGILFWALWALTSKSFQYEVIPALDIQFTRIKRDEVLITRERTPKPERPIVVDDINVPRIPSETDTEIDVVIPVSDVATPDFDRSGIPMGRDGDVVPLVRIQPAYPLREATRGIEGWVTLQFDISATGAVTNVVVVESEPGTAFDKAAVDAVMRWRYNPRVVNGQPVERVGVQTKISFTLEGEQP